MRKPLSFLFGIALVLGMVVVSTGCMNEAVAKVSRVLDTLSASKARHVVMTAENRLGKVEGITEAEIVMDSFEDFTLSGDDAVLKAGYNVAGVPSDLQQETMPDAFIKDGFYYYLYLDPDSLQQRYIKQPVGDTGMKSYKKLFLPPKLVGQAVQAGRVKITVAGRDVDAEVYNVALSQDYLDKLIQRNGPGAAGSLLSLYPEKARARTEMEVPPDVYKFHGYTCRIYLEDGRFVRYEFSFSLTLDNSKFLVYPGNVSGFTDYQYKETIDVLETGDYLPIDFPAFTDENTMPPPSFGD